MSTSLVCLSRVCSDHRLMSTHKVLGYAALRIRRPVSWLSIQAKHQQNSPLCGSSHRESLLVRSDHGITTPPFTLEQAIFHLFQSFCSILSAMQHCMHGPQQLGLPRTAVVGCRSQRVCARYVRCCSCSCCPVLPCIYLSASPCPSGLSKQPLSSHGVDSSGCAR